MYQGKFCSPNKTLAYKYGYDLIGIYLYLIVSYIEKLHTNCNVILALLRCPFKSYPSNPIL